MTRIRGFSLLEIMLALIVVGIGISVVLTFSASNRQETSSRAGGNDYSIITNDILQKFVGKNGDIQTCNSNAPNGACPLKDQFGNTTEITAYDYLCGNTSNNYHAPSATACTTTPPACGDENKSPPIITSDQYKALCNAGLDLLTTKVTLTSSKSDI
jgi:prepilin-type N-terminal cleavage/methylation domain-containing protein